MATLGKIRKHGVLLVAAIAIALFLFVAGDLVKGGESLFQKNQQTVAQIDGESVSIQDFQKLFEEFQGYYEIVNGASLSGEDELNRVKDEAWQTFVQNTLIQKECEELGLTVTDNEVAEIIKNGQSQLLQVPIFMNQQTGRYDYSLVQSFLNDYKQLKESGAQIQDEAEKAYKYYMFAQKQIRNQSLVQKYQILLSKAMISNPVEAKQNFESRSNETDVLLASMPTSMIADDKITVTDEEIKAKYNEDKEQYQQILETRDIKYIDVAISPSDADKKAAEDEMANAFDQLAASASNTEAGNICRQLTSQVLYTDILKKKEAFPMMIANLLDSTAVGTVSAPKYDAMTNTYYTFKVLDKQTEADSVLYRQIVVGGTDEAATKASADSIVNAIKGGAAFAEIAKKYNQTSDSTWVSTAQYQNSRLDADNALFVSTIYGMQPNEIKAIKLSNGYSFVLQVLDKHNPVQKYNVAAVVKTLNFSDATYNAAYNKFNSFLAENNTAEKIEANAEKEGYSLLPYPDLTSNQHSVAGIHGTRDALKWIFDDASEKEVSQLYECGDNNHLLVAILDKVNKKGYRPIDKESSNIKAKLINEKKVAQLAEQLNGVKSIADAKAKGAVVDTISHISFASPAFISATASSEPLISVAAAKAQKGAFVGPIKGEGGAYVMQVVDKKKTADQFDAKQEEAQVSQTHLRVAMQTLINVLYLQANVTDNRYKFF
ncbi:MAG: SurA N-terminal domain-containing protein [Bacteroidaceae bacterium]|nr:SurA N-terminal domain-containing protein [Bacteroidaceae bacterium]